MCISQIIVILVILVHLIVFKCFWWKWIEIDWAALIIECRVHFKARNVMQLLDAYLLAHNWLTLIKIAWPCWPHEVLYFLHKYIVEACILSKVQTTAWTISPLLSFISTKQEWFYMIFILDNLIYICYGGYRQATSCFLGMQPARTLEMLLLKLV